MPETFTLGPLLVPTRVAAFLIAVLAAYAISKRLARRSGLDVSWTGGTAEGGVIWGLVAARAAYVALHWPAFAPEPWTALYVWQPGYLPVAGLAGGALYVVYRLWKQQRDNLLVYFRTLSAGFAVGAVLLALVLGTMGWFQGPGVLRAGDKVPDFRLVNLDGDPVSFSDLRGKGVVLNLWATWCPPCRREMPLLDSAWNEYRSKDVVIVGVDIGEPIEVARRFIDTHGFTYPIWTESGSKNDNTMDTHELLPLFGSAGLPTTIFVRPDGRIEDIYIGELNRALLLEKIPKLIPRFSEP